MGDEEMNSYRNKVQSYRVDGFIIVRTRRQDARIDYLCNAKFPFASFGRIEGVCEFPYVDMDNRYGMRLISRHLAGLGHQKIAFIAAPDYLMFAHARLEGFKEGLEEESIRLDDSMVVVGDLTQLDGFRQAEILLDRSHAPTAIVACNDLMALGAISAAQKRDMKVGEDIAIIGFDDIPQAELNHPSLTTLHQPLYKIGSMVCEMLIQCLKGEQLEVQTILLKPTLIIRESCGGNQVEK
jgi:LacI family transcriptional regulator